MSAIKYILEIADQVKICDEHSFEICGEKVMAANFDPYTSWKGKMIDFGNNVQPKFARYEKLKEKLNIYIYQYFYSTGSAQPDVDLIKKYGTFTSYPNEQDDFMRRLSEYNHTVDRYDLSWEIKKLGVEGILASKNDAHREVGFDELTSQYDTHNLREGNLVNILNRKEDFYLQPYFYYVFGNDRTDDGGELVRFYFNFDPEHIHLLINALTSNFNDYEVPFSFKCLNHPEYYKCRADGAVLYLDKRYHQIGWKLLRRIYNELQQHFMDLVPIFTHHIEKGLGFAENPGKHQSFGMSRCEAVAELLLWLYDNDQNINESIIQNQLLQNGIDVQRIFLNMDSGIQYPFITY